jgi:SAM-dependent methyltransferase
MSSSGWDHMAEWWDDHLGEEGDLWHRALIDPPLLRLAGQVSGKCVLDLACGNGYLSRRFAREARQGHRSGCECTAYCACPEQGGTRSPRHSLSRGRCSPSLHARRWGV